MSFTLRNCLFGEANLNILYLFSSISGKEKKNAAETEN